MSSSKAHPTFPELLAAFAVIGFSSFGGWLAYFHDAFVEKRHWISNQEYLEGAAVANFVPGASFLNFAIFLSHRLGGWSAVVPSMVLIVAPGAAAMVVLSAAYGSTFAHLPVITSALRGLAAAAAGLVILTPIRLLRSGGHGGPNLAVAAAAFTALALLRLPMLVVVPPLAVFAVWLNRKQQP